MQAVMLPQQFVQPVGQRLQRHADASDPLGQRRARQRHALARGDLLDPEQRQMIEIFAGSDPRQQPYGGHAAIDDRWWDRRGRHRLAWTALCDSPLARHCATRSSHTFCRSLFGTVTSRSDREDSLAMPIRNSWMGRLDACEARYLETSTRTRAREHISAR